VTPRTPNQLELLPRELLEGRRWVVWTTENRNGTRTQVPRVPHTPHLHASVTTPETWGTFEQAIAAALDEHVDGIGRVLGDGLLVLVLDACRDPRTEEILPEAAVIVARVNSYTEISPSGTDLYVWSKGRLPKGGRRSGPIELYERDRYITVTGAHLEGTPWTIEDRTEQLASLHTATFGPLESQDPELVDAVIVLTARSLKSTDKFARLWRGEIVGDASENDFTLCRELVKRVGTDAGQIDRLVRKSKLMRGKWDERHGNDTYGYRTIQHAIEAHRSAAVPSAPSTRRQGLSPLLINLSDVKPEPVEWIWVGRVAVGKTTILCGDPGLGKSFITLDMVARISTGRPWPDGSPSGEPANVLLLSAEDGLRDTIRPRLDALGADVRRVTALEIVVSADRSERGIQLGDIDALEAAVTATRARVVFIDPMTAYLGNTDSHRDADVRALLAPVARLADQKRFGLVAVMHLGKSTQRSAVYRPGGSIAFTASARAVFAVAKHPDRDDRRIFGPIKNNLSAPPPALTYCINEETLTWDPEPLTDFDVEALLSGAPVRRKERRENDTWLKQVLANGPVEVTRIQQEASAAGLSWRSVNRAKSRLNVSAFRTGWGGTGKWFWTLENPKAATEEPEHG
jgi:putative DNA primase/helicase